MMMCFPSEDYPFERICPICGHPLFPTYEWGYRRGVKKEIYLCSYSCCNEYDRREEMELEREYKDLLPLFALFYAELKNHRGVVTTRRVVDEGARLSIRKKRVAKHWVRFASETGLSKSKHGYRWIGDRYDKH